MKKNIFMVVVCFLITTATFAQKRGDLISTEQIASWTPDQQKEYLQNQLGVGQGRELPISPEVLNTLLSFVSQGIYPNDLDIYKVRYWTQASNDSLVQATGSILIPRNNHGKTMIILGRGHITDRNDVFSNLRGGGGSNLFGTVYGMLDFITVIPDYIGSGAGEGREKAFNHLEGGRSMVDMYRAALQITDKLDVKRNNQVFVGGYSQGGGNAMSTIKMIQEEGLEDELPVHFAMFGGGPYDMSETTLEYSLALEDHNDPEYYFMFLRGADDAGYDIYDDPHDFISEKYWGEWDQFAETDIIIKQNLSRNFKDMITPDAFQKISDKNSDLRKYARSLDVYDWKNRIQTIMVYGTSDTEVPYQNTIVARKAQRGKFPWYRFWDKAKIISLNIGKQDHVTTGVFTLLYSMPTFMARRTSWNISHPWYYFFDEKQSVEPALAINYSPIHPTIRLHTDKHGSTRSAVSNIEVKDIEGNAIFQQSRISSDESLSLSDLSDGLYTISYNEEGRDRMELFVKQSPEVFYKQEEAGIPLVKENDGWKLDVSDLDEKITDVRLYDGDNNYIKSLTVDNDAIWIKGVIRGAYIIEVATDEQYYYLGFDNKRDVSDSSIIIYDSNRNEVTINASLDSYQIYDLQGKLVRDVSIDRKRVRHQLPTDIEDGIYILSIQSQGQTFSRKVIVRK